MEGILTSAGPNTITAASLPNISSVINGGIAFNLNPGILAGTRNQLPRGRAHEVLEQC